MPPTISKNARPRRRLASSLAAPIFALAFAHSTAHARLGPSSPPATSRFSERLPSSTFMVSTDTHQALLMSRLPDGNFKIETCLINPSLDANPGVQEKPGNLINCELLRPETGEVEPDVLREVSLAEFQRNLEASPELHYLWGNLGLAGNVMPVGWELATSAFLSWESMKVVWATVAQSRFDRSVAQTDAEAAKSARKLERFGGIVSVLAFANVAKLVAMGAINAPTYYDLAKMRYWQADFITNASVTPFVSGKMIKAVHDAFGNAVVAAKTTRAALAEQLK